MVEMAKMKRDQLKHGIQGSYDEIAQIYSDFSKDPWVFTAITHPKRGCIIFQALLELAEYAGLDLDTVYDNDEHLTDENLEWSMLKEEENLILTVHFMQSWKRTKTTFPTSFSNLSLCNPSVEMN